VRLLAFIFVPTLVIAVAVPWIFLSARRMVRGLDRHLATRGIFRILQPGGGPTRVGVVGGVGVRLDTVTRQTDAGWWHVVRASRDLSLVHAGLDWTPPSDRPLAPPGPEAQVSPDEAERLARESLAEVPQQGIELERKGDLVEVRVNSKLEPQIIDRLIDVACAWADRVRPPTGSVAALPEGIGPVAFLSLLATIPVALFIGAFATVWFESVQSVVEHVCDPGDRLIVRAETRGRGTGYDTFCRKASGETYGCFAAEAAAFDLTFPFTFGAVFVALMLRRRERRPFELP